jgi:hypothetical protein
MQSWPRCSIGCARPAVAGGLALVTELESDRFPLKLLDGTPFSSYMLPGLILTAAVGGKNPMRMVGCAIPLNCTQR